MYENDDLINKCFTIKLNESTDMNRQTDKMFNTQSLFLIENLSLRMWFSHVGVLGTTTDRVGLSNTKKPAGIA